MDRIFQIYPQTQSAKDDYQKQLKKKREQLAEKESQLAEIEGRMAVLESTLQDMPAESPPDDGAGSAPAKPTSLPAMKAELDAKRAEFADLKKQAKQDLATFESQQSQIILGRIYQALRDLAVEEQVTVVVDKSSILYGDATVDLTEKLQQRVRGY